MPQLIELASTGRAAPLRLEYEHIPGPAGAPLVIFLHEGLGSLATWKDFPQRLCAAGNFRGLLYTRQGYGGSSDVPAGKWPADYMHAEAHDVLPRLLQALGMEGERPWIFGHSDGATIALLYAAKFPDSLAGLVAVAPHVKVEEITVEGVLHAGRAYPDGRLRSSLPRFHRDGDAVFWRWHDTWTDPGFRAWNIEGVLGQIKCPVLAVQGFDDEFATMEQLDSIQRHVPHAQLLKMEQCGHIPHRDQPEALIRATVGFIGTASTG